MRTMYVMSLDDLLGWKSTLKSRFAHRHDFFDIPVEYQTHIELKEKVEHYLSKLDLRLKQILWLKIQGCTIKDMERILGTNREYLRLDINWIKFLWDNLERMPMK